MNGGNGATTDRIMKQYFYTTLEVFIMAGMGAVWLGGVGYIALKLMGLL